MNIHFTRISQSREARVAFRRSQFVLALLGVLVASSGMQAVLGDSGDAGAFYKLPFRWTNQEEPNQEPGKRPLKPADPRAAATWTESEQAEEPRGWGWLRPFRAQAEQPVRLPRPASEPSGVAMATDQEQSISATGTISPAKQVAGAAPTFEWPSTPAETPPEIALGPANADRPVNQSNPVAQSNQKPQGLNPFGWTNASEPTKEGTGDRQASAVRKATLEETISEATGGLLPGRQGLAEIASPFSWSNQPNPVASPQPFEPPVQTSFSESVKQSLSWQDQPSDSEKARLSASRPPEDATVEELIEWEKATYPWIRPFYWAEDLSEPMPPSYEELRDSTRTGPAGTRGTFFAQPFFWTNETPVMATKPQGARTISFLQGDEELPVPPEQSRGAGQGELLRDQPTEAGTDTLADSEDGEKGKIGEAETLGKEPEDTSLQFLRADTVLLDPGEAQYDYGMTYALFDLRLPRFVPIAQGSDIVTVEMARFRRRELVVPLEVRLRIDQADTAVFECSLRLVQYGVYIWRFRGIRE